MFNTHINSLRSLRLGLVLVFTLLMAATSLAEDVINIEAMGQTINKETTWENCSVNIIGNGTVTFSRRIYIEGSVTLNLGAQTTLDAQNGIGVHDGHSLTITGEGNLNTRSGSSNENSPLGGSKGNGIANAGSITILGGNITAINTGSLSYYFGAAIGGAELGSGGNITIRGGTVNAISDSGSRGCKGAGIGGGFNGNAGTITITGGVVKATSGTYGAAAIGGGTINESGKGKGGSITISGGQVTAVSLRGNGIGPGRDGSTREGTAGTISLSWTESTDFINANSYRGDISIEGDSRFYYEGSTDLVLADELAKRQNQKIIPVELDNNSIALANLQMQGYSILPNGAIKYINYDVYDYNGNKLIKGTHYTETVGYSVDATGAMEEDKLMLTIKGKSPYFGSQSFIMWVNTAELTQDGSERYVTIPEKRKMTLKITESEIKDGLTSFKVYEAGGKNHVLGKEWDGVLVINIPDNSNYLIQLSGKALAADRTSKNDLIDCELIYEGYLTVYDNDEASGTILLENSELIYDYLPSPVAVIPTITSTGKNLAIRYQERYGYSDLDLSVTLVPADRKYNVNLPDRFTGGQVTANLRQAKANDNITLTVTPDEGYMLNELRVVNADGEAVNVTDCNWYTDWSETISKTVTFKMPTQNVTVAAVFTNKLNSDEGGLYVNMPHSGTKNMVIPDNITSFKLYDDGGKDGDFQPLSDGTLAITAPSGKVMQFSGKSFMVDNSSSESYYAIYNDPPKSYGQKLAYGNQQKEETLYPVVSEGNTAYVRLKAADISRTDFFHKYGLDLNVKVFTPAVYSVSSDKNMEHGNVMFDKTQVVTNGTINVTVSSDEGYVLKDIDAFDADGKIVMTKPDTVQWGDAVYYAASTGYSFKMRSSDATVTPTFMPKTDFFVNMPKTGQRDIIIQDDMTSFRVYDNSGKDGFYFTNDDGKLLLTAPEDCMMKVSGYVKLMYTSAEEDYLDIYDGSSTNAKRLGRFRGYKNSSTTSVTASSSTNQMLLHFISNGYGYVKDGGGVYLTVSVIKRFTSSDITVAAIEDQTYTGSRICPAISVTDGEKVLEPGVDFTTQCSNNISVGTASMTITGKGHYTGGISKQFKIAKAPLMIIAKDKSIIYGDKPANAGVEYAGFLGGDKENSLSGSIVFSYDYAQYDKVGEYAIMPSGLESNNYEIEFVAGKLTVGPKEISIAWDDKETSFTYNGKAQAPNATAGGLLNNDECNIIIDSVMNVGKYSAEAIDLTNINYKLPENRDGPDFEITKAPLTVTAKNATIAYGDEPSNAGVEYSGFVGDDNENDLNDSIVFNYDYAQFDKVGKYVIIPGGLSSDNYNITFVEGELTVEPKKLTVTAKNDTITYGDEPSNAGVEYSGFVGDDNESSLDDSLIFSYEYGQYGKPGDYAIIPSGPRSDKYEIEFVEGKLTVLPKKLTVTALNDTIVYGDEPASAGIAYDGFVGKETSNVLTGELAFEINYKQYGDVGEFAITPSGLANDNYEIEFVAGKLTVEPKVVFIAWDDETSFTYDGKAHAPNAAAEGLVNNDECNLVIDSATNAGKYTAKVTDLSNKNYKLPATGLEQSFEIAKIPLTVSAKNATIVYGDEPSNAGVEFSGFIGEDNEKSLDGALVYSYNYKQYGNVGEFAITPGGLTSDNYEITFVDGKLTVEPKELTIIWGEQTSFVYDAEDHNPTAKLGGIVNNDRMPWYLTGFQTNVGKHTAIVTEIGNSNYKLPKTGCEKEYEITKAPLKITAMNNTIVYGDKPIDGGIMYGEFAGMESSKVLKGTLTFEFSYKQYGDVGEYTITPSGLTADNYEIEFVAGKLTVEPKEVSVAWDKQTSFTYNSFAQAPSATAEGLLNNDQCDFTVAGAATDAGKYTATVTGLNNKNYKLPATGLEQPFEITKASVTISAKDNSIVYGEMPSNAGVVFSGFSGLDNEKSLNGSLVYSYDYKQYGVVGEYTITPSGLTADNYEIEFVAGKLNVEPKAVSIAWGKSSFAYNGAAQVPAATAEGLVNSDKCGLTVAGAATNAGKYTATVTGLNNKNYKLPATGLEQAFEITKANPTIVKSPVAVENLVYNGKAQTLVTAGEAKNGTLVYKLASEEKYSEALPTATNGGDYTVYFMVLGNANYNDLEAQTLTASIKVPASSSSVIASSSSSAPASSSSTVEPGSSSSDSTTPVATTTLAGTFRVVYARNELVVTNSVASELKVAVFDVQGSLKMHYRGSAAGNHFVSLKKFVPGIYLVRVESSGKMQMLQVHVK